VLLSTALKKLAILPSCGYKWDADMSLMDRIGFPPSMHYRNITVIVYIWSLPCCCQQVIEGILTATSWKRVAGDPHLGSMYRRKIKAKRRTRRLHLPFDVCTKYVAV
jgi:hypothetical protein